MIIYTTHKLSYKTNMISHSRTSPLEIVRAQGKAQSVQPLDLGARVRELRKAQGWTLEEAAQRAGLARSTLSKIENHQMSPTFDAVQKLATGLGIGVPQLFTPQEAKRDFARRVITRKDDSEALITPTYEHRMLQSELLGKKMLPYHATIRARSFDDFDGWVRHDGEEFMFVLSGVVGFYTEYYEMAEMRRGDSAYYDASMGHNLVSLSTDDAEVLWVTSL